MTPYEKAALLKRLSQNLDAAKRSGEEYRSQNILQEISTHRSIIFQDRLSSSFSLAAIDH
jgi:hypothetical protein